MFDLTKNIKLAPDLQKKYTIGRILLHVLFLFAVFFVADRILFPMVAYDFSFLNLNSQKNTLNPPLQNAILPIDGIVKANSDLLFNAYTSGNFSSANITLTTDKKDANLDGDKITLQKSYQAFFYPIGDPIGFRDGTLLTTPDGNYYIISDGMLRKFADIDIILQFGFAKDAFQLVSLSDLAYNTPGPDITTANTYPDNSLFAIGDSYYELENQQMTPFISPRAFLSQFDTEQAIVKDESFLSNFTMSQSYVGFADGTVASSDLSVFVLSKGKSYPFIDPQTFESLGYDWNNVLPLGPDELGSYEQQKALRVSQPHPDGALFQDINSKKYFIIQDGKKRPIETEAIEKNYSKLHALSADLNGTQQISSCILKRQFMAANTYSCIVPLQNLNHLIGNDYQIHTSLSNDTKISTINTTFFTQLTWLNLRDSLSSIKQKLISNYVPAQ